MITRKATLNDDKYLTSDSTENLIAIIFLLLVFLFINNNFSMFFFFFNVTRDPNKLLLTHLASKDFRYFLATLMTHLFSLNITKLSTDIRRKYNTISGTFRFDKTLLVTIFLFCLIATKDFF